MKIKKCLQCHIEKPVGCFSNANNSKGGDGFAHACIECMLTMTEQQKTALVTAQWRKRNSEKAESQRVRSHLERSYGLAPEEFQALSNEQNSVCAICGERPNVTDKSGRIQALSVDHDHATGAVRGLLCGSCNQGLSLFRDDPNLLTAAIAYLKKRR